MTIPSFGTWLEFFPFTGRVLYVVNGRIAAYWLLPGYTDATTEV